MTFLNDALLVGVVAAEDDAGFVGGSDLVVPPDDRGGRALAEVLLEDLGAIALNKDCISSAQIQDLIPLENKYNGGSLTMILCVPGHCNSLLKTKCDFFPLSSVA